MPRMKNINKLDLLFGVYIFCVIVSELMGAKVFNIVHLGSYQLRASVAIFLIPVVYSINDVICEVHGKEKMRWYIKISLIIITLLILAAALFTRLPAATRFLPTEAAYDTIFSMSVRMSIASLVAFAVADFLDLYIFAKLKAKLHRYGLWFRNNASNFLSEWIDSIVFMFLAFYSLQQGFGSNVSFLFSLIFPYRALKCLMSVIGTPLVYAWVKRLRKKSD